MIRLLFLSFPLQRLMTVARTKQDKTEMKSVIEEGFSEYSLPCLKYDNDLAGFLAATNAIMPGWSQNTFWSVMKRPCCNNNNSLCGSAVDDDNDNDDGGGDMTWTWTATCTQRQKLWQSAMAAIKAFLFLLQWFPPPWILHVCFNQIPLAIFVSLACL